MNWNIGRGKLGIFKPLLGTWVCQTNSDLGQVTCSRTFKKTLKNKYIKLEVNWIFENKTYAEFCLFGINQDKQLTFWSFTDDGKQSKGVLTQALDIHAGAVAFEAQMPAGIARQIYWPDDDCGFHWAVESKTNKGWNRFVTHHYISD